MIALRPPEIIVYLGKAVLTKTPCPSDKEKYTQAPARIRLEKSLRGLFPLTSGYVIPISLRTVASVTFHDGKCAGTDHLVIEPLHFGYRHPSAEVVATVLKANNVFEIDSLTGIKLCVVGRSGHDYIDL